jgi:ribosomal protein S18 acetylase RimI-like enzyme
MVKSELIIRRADEADGPELLALIRIAMAVYARNSGISAVLESQLETLDDLLAHIRSDVVFVAERRGRLVGTVRLVCGEDGSAYFCRFAVLPDVQRGGVGKEIYRTAENYLRSQGIRTVRLHTALTNKPLLAFYEARGFRLIEESTGRGYSRGTFQKVLD